MTDHDPKPDGFHIKAPSKEWLKRAEKWEEDVSVIAAGVPDPKPLSADEIAEGKRLLVAYQNASAFSQLAAEDALARWAGDNVDRLLAAAERDARIHADVNEFAKSGSVSALLQEIATLRAAKEAGEQRISEWKYEFECANQRARTERQTAELAEQERDYFAGYAGDLRAITDCMNRLGYPYHPERPDPNDTIGRLNEMWGNYHTMKARAEKAEQELAAAEAREKDTRNHLEETMAGDYQRRVVLDAELVRLDARAKQAEQERDEWRVRAEGLQREIQEWRTMAALRGGSAGMYLDDGELQDNRAHPFIDWRRDSIEEIKAKNWQRGVDALGGAGEGP